MRPFFHPLSSSSSPAAAALSLSFRFSGLVQSILPSPVTTVLSPAATYRSSCSCSTAELSCVVRERARDGSQTHGSQSGKRYLFSHSSHAFEQVIPCFIRSFSLSFSAVAALLFPPLMQARAQEKEKKREKREREISGKGRREKRDVTQESKDAVTACDMHAISCVSRLVSSLSLFHSPADCLRCRRRLSRMLLASHTLTHTHTRRE